MQPAYKITPLKVPSNAKLNTAEKFASCRPKTANICTVEAKITRPHFQVEVRRYCWDSPLEPTLYQNDVCYLELALQPRPSETEVKYSGGKNQNNYVPTGNCSFIPAGYQAMMRGAKGEQKVVGCLFEMSAFKSLVDWKWTPLEIAACFNITNINIRTALVRLAQEAMSPDYQSDRLVDALFEFLIVELSRHIRATRIVSKEPHGKLSPQQLLMIENHISNTGSEFPQTSTLAKECGISNRHLARMFKRTTGKTITEYITEARINKAKLKLANSDQLIKEIAYECGFKGQSSFAQTFRKATGFTPRQFRNRSQSKD